MGVHVANHLGWEEMLSQTHNQSVLINGYILTGWQRYDHFASLCEFLPVAIPTLKCCLIALQRGKFECEEVEEAKKILGNFFLKKLWTCESSIFSLTKYWGNQSSTFFLPKFWGKQSSTFP